MRTHAAGLLGAVNDDVLVAPLNVAVCAKRNLDGGRVDVPDILVRPRTGIFRPGPTPPLPNDDAPSCPFRSMPPFHSSRWHSRTSSWTFSCASCVSSPRSRRFKSRRLGTCALLCAGRSTMAHLARSRYQRPSRATMRRPRPSRSSWSRRCTPPPRRTGKLHCRQPHHRYRPQLRWLRPPPGRCRRLRPRSRVPCVGGAVRRSPPRSSPSCA